MNRDYATGESKTVSLFIGTEIETTPAYGSKTLFVVGVQDIAKIKETAIKNDCSHIYLGANQSFKLSPKWNYEWEKWDHMVLELCKDFLVTLDFDSSLVDLVVDHCWAESNNFIPMISVKLPYLNQLGYNACLKLDDHDFKYSNPGVWVHHINDLMSRNTFTDWREYTKDQIIE